MDLGLSGARALVGGASAGLGAAVADALAAEGTAVAVTARRKEALDVVAARTGAVSVPCDLSTATGPEEAVEAAIGELGGLDILVVNTGGPPAGNLADIDEAAWAAAVQGSLLSAVRLVRAAVAPLRRSDRAAVLCVLASTVRQPLPRMITSNVLRPAVAGLVKSLALELAPAIRVNGIAPGRIHTERADVLDAVWAEQEGVAPSEMRRRAEANIPLGRYGRPDEFGRVAAFLVSPAASYVSAQILPVDGAMTRSLP